jgi:hypothetical protein
MDNAPLWPALTATAATAHSGLPSLSLGPGGHPEPGLASQRKPERRKNRRKLLATAPTGAALRAADGGRPVTATETEAYNCLQKGNDNKHLISLTSAQC